jgi:hypothetical protein
MTEDPSGLDRRDIPAKDVQIGTADGHRVDPDDGVAVVGDLRVRNGFPGVSTGPVVNDRFHDGTSVRLGHSVIHSLKRGIRTF